MELGDCLTAIAVQEDEDELDDEDEESSKIVDMESSKVVDMEVFSQLIELDEEDPEFPFSKEMVEQYFSQANTTFGELDEAL